MVNWNAHWSNKAGVNMNIGLIIYGEDGELEYGGTTKNKNKLLIV